MTISPHPQSAAVLSGLEQLARETASTQWRGLLIIRANHEVRFQWPQAALVLAASLADYREYLGTTQSLLVLDLRATLHADALAAMVPTLRAQGVVILVLPYENSPFSERLLNALPAVSCQCLTLNPVASNAIYEVDLTGFVAAIQAAVPPSSGQECSTMTLTTEQSRIYHQLFRHIQGQVPAPALLNAPRGRGKSTLLGVLARELSEQGIAVWVCAPSRRQATTLLAAAGISLQSPDGAGKLSFIAPDALLAGGRELIDGHLIVDEASSLPRHMLDLLIKRYPRVIMATTSEGYETCGRGFLLQFQTQLSSMFHHFLSLQLEQPIRFAANCPVENWLNRALLLTPSGFSTRSSDGSYPSETTSTTASNDLSGCDISYTMQHASTLDDDTLARCFYLLMDAHYQTSPNDLKLLLNDPSQYLHLQWATENSRRALAGVIWLSEEGELDTALATAVISGTRRPPGNLLAQNLARHLQDPAPACALWLRVVRIAVRNDSQQQGLGSALLHHVITQVSQAENYASVAGIGTSFASAPQINRFWRNHNFRPVRIGSRKDSITGRHSLLMVYPLQPDWIKAVETWANYFVQELPAYQQLYQLSDDYLASICHKEKKALGASPDLAHSQANELAYAAWAREKTHAFACGYLDLDSMRPTLLTRYPREVENNPLLKAAVLSSVLSQDGKRRLKLSGRKALIQQVRKVCSLLAGKT